MEKEQDQRQDTNFTLDNVINPLNARWAFEMTNNKSEFTLRRKLINHFAKVYMNKVLTEAASEGINYLCQNGPIRNVDLTPLLDKMNFLNIFIFIDAKKPKFIKSYFY